MNPEVSVIIPAYNTEAYIAQAIESALGQTEPNIEVIVVDNGSTDATREIAQGFDDDRLKVIVIHQNIGPSGARNLAMKVATGKWIAQLDSDDWYAPQRLEKLLQVAYTENADMVADDIYFICDGEKLPWSTLLNESGEQINKIRHIEPVYFVETDVLGRRGLHLGLTKPLCKRDFLLEHGIEYEETLIVSPDFWFDVSCLAQGADFVLVSEPYYFYRSRSGSIVTGSQEEHLNEFCKASQYYLEQEYIKKNHELVHTLSKHQAFLEQARPYFRVVDSFRRRGLLSTLKEMVCNPYFFVHFLIQLPRIISRRLHYYSSNHTPPSTNSSKFTSSKS